MFSRRTFMSGMAAGLAGIKWGLRGLFDLRYVMQGAPGAETVINGKRYLYFGGTGYYGLINNPVMRKAADEALEKYGMHSSTSRGTTGYGNTPLYAEVEKKTAEYYGVEDSFTSPPVTWRTLPDTRLWTVSTKSTRSLWTRTHTTA